MVLFAGGKAETFQMYRDAYECGRRTPLETKAYGNRLSNKVF